MRRCSHRQAHGFMMCRSIQLMIKESPDQPGRLPRMTYCRHCKAWYLKHRPWWKILR